MHEKRQIKGIREAREEGGGIPGDTGGGCGLGNTLSFILK